LEAGDTHQEVELQPPKVQIVTNFMKFLHVDTSGEARKSVSPYFRQKHARIMAPSASVPTHTILISCSDKTLHLYIIKGRVLKNENK
jgi:hypothetical protein